MDTSGDGVGATDARACGWPLAGRISYLDRARRGRFASDVGDFVPIPRYDDYQARATLCVAPRRGAGAHLPGLRRSPASRRSPRPTRRSGARRTPTRLQAPHPALHAPAARRGELRRHAVDRIRHSADDELVRAASDSPEHQNVAVRVARRRYRRRVAPGMTLSFGLDFQMRSVSADRGGRSTFRRARATSSSSANRRRRRGGGQVGRHPDRHGALHHRGDRSRAADADPGAAASNRRSSREARSSRIAESSAPLGYARFDIPNNPGPRFLRLDAEPAPRRGVPRHQAPRLHRGRRRLRAAARSRRHERRVRQPDHQHVSRALHLSGGGIFKLPPTLTFEAIGFYKYIYDLVSRSALASPPLAQALTQDGVGPHLRRSGAAAAGAGAWLLRLDQLFAHPQRAARPRRAGLASVRLRPDARAGRAGELPVRPRVGGRCPVPLHHRHAAHAGDRRPSTTSRRTTTNPCSAPTTRSGCRRSISSTCASRKSGSCGATKLKCSSTCRT